MNLWTSEDISKILIQLDEMGLPFSKYAISQEKGKIKLLGRGGSAEVYEAQTRSSQMQDYAMKVIGFRNQNVDPEIFNESVQVQQDIGYFQYNVVKIYKHTEVWVTLDDKDNVLTAVNEKPETISRTTIKLQFVLMEKIPSVITRTNVGNIKMLPETLAHGDEQEILKLAYDVGLALKRAHNKNVLHRDVKLENVFYSEKKKQYKLGDFGIAKKTKDGFAETIAFTKGYAAPEVRLSDERYDNTADIYSFGMMLYVLANNLKFPDSNTYNVNAGIQYCPGYIVPEPECDISPDLYEVIKKACMYNADDRYQSMEEMLLDIEKMMYSVRPGYKKSVLVVGSLMLALGIVIWKLTMAPDMIIGFSLWEYIFWAGCYGKGILEVLKKDTSLLSMGALGVGIYLIVGSEFSWIKLFFLLLMTFSPGYISGNLSASMLIANVVSLIQQADGTNFFLDREYSWVAITVISIAVILLYEYDVLSLEDRRYEKLYHKKRFDWILIAAVYALLFFAGLLANSEGKRIFRMIAGEQISNFFFSFDQKKVGLCGLGFCLFWIGRERLLRFRQMKIPRIHS